MKKGAFMKSEKERNRKIYQEYLEGATYTELAEKYSVSTTRVRKIFQMEKMREECNENEVFKVLFALCDDEQLISKTITVLQRIGATSKEELLKLDRKTIKKARNCGVVMVELIMKMKEEMEE